jgi:hypothetical protein
MIGRFGFLLAVVVASVFMVSCSDDSYVPPLSCLGYMLNEQIKDTNTNILSVADNNFLKNRPFEMYKMRCTENFGGIKFETCNLNVSERVGVLLISAETTTYVGQFELAVKRMSKLLGKPLVKEENIASWNYCGGELTLDRRPYVTALVFMNPSFAGRKLRESK